MVLENIYKANTKFLRAIFFTASSRFESQKEYDKIFNIITPPDKRPYFEDLSLAELGAVPEKIQSQPVVYDEIQEAYAVKYSYITIALGYQMSKEMKAHDQHNIMAKLNTLLAYSLHETRETRFWNIINLAFSANVLGGDAKSLCATDHPLKKGGTQSNMVATTAFAKTPLENALINFKKMKSDANHFAPQTPELLLGPVELDRKFFEVLSSRQSPYTTDNEENYFFKKLKPMTTKRITSTTQWMLLSKKGDVGKNGKVIFSPDSHMLNILWFWKNNYESNADFDVKASKTTVDERLTYGFSDFRGVYGSQGA